MQKELHEVRSEKTRLSTLCKNYELTIERLKRQIKNQDGTEEIIAKVMKKSDLEILTANEKTEDAKNKIQKLQEIV